MTGAVAFGAADIRRRQLAELLSRRAAGSAERRLSVGQERILRLARLTPDLPLYNVAAGWQIDGPLDAPMLFRAIERIRDRHDILRSTFHDTDTGLIQRIAPPQANGPGPVREVDLSDDPDTAPAVIAREAACHFDLARGPLWRLVLLRLGPERRQMLLVMHHIITDGWSYDLFVAELSTLYAAFAADAPDPLPPLSLQYADYGDRQRRDLEGPEVAAQVEAWAARLAGRIPALALPGAGTGDGRTDPEGSRSAASLPTAIDPALTARLSDLARTEGATLFMVLLAGFAALLARRTGQTDLLICIPASGRHRALSKGLIGYFNNLLPLRIDASGAPTLRELVQRTRAATLDAYRGQDVPFQRLADLPALRRIPLSRLLFSLDMPWPPVLGLEGLTCTPLVTETGTADFDLSVSLWMEGEGVRGALRRKTALFSESAAQELVDAYGALLAALADDPEQPLAAAVASVRESGAEVPDHNLLPRSALEAQLAHEWEKVFDIHPIGRNDDLGRLGVSSLAVAELAEHLKRVFRTEISAIDLFRAGTVAGMAAQLAEGDVAASPLAPIRSEGTRPPLFLCEGVGIYYPLLPYLPPDLPVYGLIQQVSAAGSSRVEDRAAAYVAAMRAVQPEGPYHLGGVSYGGMVAFEMAQQLRAAGQETALLALLDTPGPGAYQPYQGARRVIGYAQNAVRGGPVYLTRKLRSRLRRRGPKQAVAGPIPDQALLRAGFSRSAAAYTVQPYDGRITLFALSHRSAFTDSLFDPVLGRVDPLLGWGEVARGGVEHWPLPGEHVGILKEPYVAVLGERLHDCLLRCSGGGK